MGSKTALVLGGSGETGKEVNILIFTPNLHDLIDPQVLKQLVACPSYGKIISLGRRVLDLPESEGWERVRQEVVDFEDLDKSKEHFDGVEQAFCCLGTTRGKAGKEG